MQAPATDQSVSAIIAAEVQRLQADLVALRRDIHAHPEIGNAEHRTTEVVSQALFDVGLSPKTLSIGTGATCDILPDGAPARDLVGLRADIDALPIEDEKKVDYRSQTPGICHACGHDVHTAIVVGAGLVLHRLRDLGPLHRGVRLIFQPAEETSPGGAVDVIECGALDGVSEAYALHCDPRTVAGRVALKVGPITSAVDRIRVTLSGRGGHTSRPHLSADLVGALGAIATTTQLLLSRRVDPRSGVSMMWGHIQAGSAANAIPGHGFLEGTLRALNVDGWRIAQQLVPSLINEIAEPFGVKTDVAVTSGTPPAVNHTSGVERLSRAVTTMLGPSAVTTTEQSLGGEDFAWMLQQVPGAMARLGVRSPGIEVAPDIHQATFDVDERCIAVGVKTLVATALGL